MCPFTGYSVPRIGEFGNISGVQLSRDEGPSGTAEEAAAALLAPRNESSIRGERAADRAAARYRAKADKEKSPRRSTDGEELSGSNGSERGRKSEGISR